MMHRILAALLSTALLAVVASADDKGAPAVERGRGDGHQKGGDKAEGPKERVANGGDKAKGPGDKIGKGGKDGEKGGG
ncbi:MAG: hypothetical protein FD180_3992 [Planctomycetota bacterium]|nr:MAG: hypothetical protein FD180_3992 [Planctomycetota bacterium]